MEPPQAWVLVGPMSAVAQGDVIRFDYQDRSFAVYHTRSGFYASDGYCTHARVHLAGGLVLGDEIECPMHQGIFDIRTGKALAAPACVNLKTYPLKIEQEQIYLQIDAAHSKAAGQ